MVDDPEQIARALGGAARSGAGWLAFCPCHQNTRTPALSIGLGQNGRLVVYCFAGCSGKDILAELVRRGLIGGRPQPEDRLNHFELARRERMKAADVERRIAAARRVWSESTSAAGTLVETYLRARGLRLSNVPPDLRFHPNALHQGGARAPAMIAAVRDVSNALIGIHRTYLQSDGSGKAGLFPSKAMLGICSGGAVKLGDAQELAPLVLAEGIETALALLEATSFPTWATLSTSGLQRIELPSRFEAGALVIIAADQDPAGIDAARAARARLSAEGRAVEIAAPDMAGTDFLDVLRGAND